WYFRYYKRRLGQWFSGAHLFSIGQCRERRFTTFHNFIERRLYYRLPMSARILIAVLIKEST
uniref:Uncharacterized protein n=1 Tax=Amphimedon queenslandica TaxID=400682 RepID=A0A1X7U293_AMPQE